MNSFFYKFIDKLNVKSFTILSSLILIIGGLVLCLKDLRVNGSINIKTALVEGQIETGSLGLMIIFLGVFVLIIVNLKKTIIPFDNQVVELTINGNKIKTKGLSYRKLKEISAMVHRYKDNDSEDYDSN